MRAPGKPLWSAGAISQHMWNTPKRAKRVYRLASIDPTFPVYHEGGQVCGWSHKLDAWREEEQEARGYKPAKVPELLPSAPVPNPPKGRKRKPQAEARA